MVRSRLWNRKPGFNKFKPDVFLTNEHRLTGQRFNAKDYSSTRTHKGSLGILTEQEVSDHWKRMGKRAVSG